MQRVIQRDVLSEMLKDYETIFAGYRPEHEAHGAALLAMLHMFDRVISE